MSRVYGLLTGFQRNRHRHGVDTSVTVNRSPIYPRVHGLRRFPPGIPIAVGVCRSSITLAEPTRFTCEIRRRFDPHGRCSVSNDTALARNHHATRTVVGNIMNDSIGLYLNDIGKVPLLTAEDERELSRVIEAGREAAGAARRRQAQRRPEGQGRRRRRRQGSVHPLQPASRGVASPAATPCPRAWTCSTSSRRATSASSTPSTSSTGAVASSSPPTPRSGSARPSAGPSTRRPASSASPVTAPPASARRCVRPPATARPSTRPTPNCTASPRRSASTRRSATTATPRSAT